uniref:Serine/threonine specific protein phosphatases domain-containing protein n=1 Tax=Lotus japonicus TaxID=34305 RepID=I3SYS3_LOTJA|nr:unknown [Lotus japonicus]
MDGFERFAQGQLITLFSATNYCGTANNAGAILVIGRGLVVVPKLIHPIPPPLQSPETSPERVMDETWMQELNIQRTSPLTSPKYNQSNFSLDGTQDGPSSGGSGMDKHSMEKLREASAAEAEAASAVWQAVQAISAEETSVSDDNSQAAETVSDGSDTEGDVHLHPRAVVVAKETVVT